METMARRQGMWRWAENSVEGHIPTIKARIPDALFIHMIRDGRDVATSLHNSRYIRTLPWKSQISLPGGGVYWEWVVERTSKDGRRLGNDYLEVHFEDLIGNTQQTLAKVGNFLDHDLDYERIRQVGYGSISKPNTLFSAELKGTFSPIGRWKKKFSPSELLRFEAMIGPTLLDQGYALASEGAKPAINLEMLAARQFYRTLFESKWRVKRLPVVRLLRPLTPQFLDANTQAEDHPPEVRTPVSQPSSGSAR